MISLSCYHGNIIYVNVDDVVDFSAQRMLCCRMNDNTWLWFDYIVVAPDS